jgi:hypothetical protein
LQQALKEVDGCNVAIRELKEYNFTCEMDSSISVAKMMWEKHPVIHRFELYHLEKRIVKKLNAKAKVCLFYLCGFADQRECSSFLLDSTGEEPFAVGCAELQK